MCILPGPTAWGWGYQKIKPRRGDIRMHELGQIATFEAAFIASVDSQADGLGCRI